MGDHTKESNYISVSGAKTVTSSSCNTADTTLKIGSLNDDYLFRSGSGSSLTLSTFSIAFTSNNNSKNLVYGYWGTKLIIFNMKIYVEDTTAQSGIYYTIPTSMMGG